MSVGFIGLGNMGQGMADNLLAKGSDLTVYTRTKAKVDAMISKGAKGAGSPQDIIDSSSLILVCLPDVKTSQELLLGPGGVITSAKAGQVIVDHSTVDIQTSRDCYAAAKARGAHFMDAPISGGPGGAAAGTLSIMVGGDKSAFTTAKPEFDHMGANVKLMGPSGAGTAMKLINQLLVGINNAAASEAFVLANAAQVDIMAAAELLKVSWGGSVMVERAAPIVAKRAFPNSGAPVRLLNKDLNIIVNFAKSEGLALELAEHSLGLYGDLMKQGKVEYDIAGILEVVEKRSGKQSNQG
jgi:2-hydroxy-3-oxopropionate reductase